MPAKLQYTFLKPWPKTFMFFRLQPAKKKGREKNYFFLNFYFYIMCQAVLVKTTHKNKLIDQIVMA